MSYRRRIIVPGYPHLVTHRARAGRSLFPTKADTESYLAVLKAQAARLGVRVAAYCLLPDHVHLVLIPPAETALVRVVQQTHRLHAARLNRREGRRAPRWQRRPQLCALDRAHLPDAVCHVESNPRRARVARSAWRHRGSSAAERVGAAPATGLLWPVTLLTPWRARRWKELLRDGVEEEFAAALRAHSRSGWPLMELETLRALERDLGRRLRPRRPGARGGGPPSGLGPHFSPNTSAIE